MRLCFVRHYKPAMRIILASLLAVTGEILSEALRTRFASAAAQCARRFAQGCVDRVVRITKAEKAATISGIVLSANW